MPIQCKIKQRAAKKSHYEKNKAKYKERSRAWTSNQCNYLRRLVDRYKILFGCCRCGYKKFGQALELHHTDESQKDRHVSDMIHRGVSTKRLKGEVRKCIILCANCHREEHIKTDVKNKALISKGLS